VLASIKTMPGNVILESMLVEIGKLRAVRAIGLLAGVFADVAPKVVSGWRARAAVESPSHLRRRSTASAVTVLAALLVEREREITDSLVDLLLATVHRIGARAERRVTHISAGHGHGEDDVRYVRRRYLTPWVCSFA
jgi:hypothetical protein